MSEQQYIERYWRDATPQDAIREPPMVARFTRYPDGFPGNSETVIDVLRGLAQYKSERGADWFDSKGNRYRTAQVYDAPDPGEGWRLIDPHKEPLREGDEFMLFFDRKRGWIHIDTEVTNWAEKNFYRRRIEQPKPEPRYEPFRWEDREQLRGRWITWKHEDGTPIEKQVAYLVKKESGELLINSRNSKWFLQNASFLDTGEPVGRKVE